MGLKGRHMLESAYSMVTSQAGHVHNLQRSQHALVNNLAVSSAKAAVLLLT